MKGRILIWLLATLFLATTTASEAQPQMARVGMLIAGTPATMKTRVDAFRRGLKELGWVEGKNVALEFRYAEGKLENLGTAAAELISLKVDLIVAASVGVQAAKKATSVIPIVMMGYGDDPVKTGLVASLANPGGNVTGVINEDLVGKRFEIFKEALPKISHVAAFWTPPASTEDFKQVQRVGQTLKVQVRSMEIAKLADIDGAFAQLATNRPNALFVLGSPVINSARLKIIGRATADKLPIIGTDARWANDGGLMAYSHDVEDHSRRSAVYVDKILKGAKPTDLPVQAPKQFDLVINVKTAKQIGVTIDPNVLARATKVIR